MEKNVDNNKLFKSKRRQIDWEATNYNLEHEYKAIDNMLCSVVVILAIAAIGGFIYALINYIIPAIISKPILLVYIPVGYIVFVLLYALIKSPKFVEFKD